MASERKSESNNSFDGQKKAFPHECGFCRESFPTVDALYAHQQDKHDPDGIMFSEIGLPK